MFLKNHKYFGRFYMTNNTPERWYIKKRQDIEKKIEEGSILHHKRKTFDSPKSNYILSVSPVAFKEDKRVWGYTVGKIFRKKMDKTGSLIDKLHRNSEKFPFIFIETHIDGHDYFIGGEDYQGQTVIRLDTSERVDFIGEKAKRDMEFCWQKFHLSPNRKIMAIEGYSKNKPTEYNEYQNIRFYNFENPLSLPYEEVGNRISFPYNEVVSWEDDGHLLVSVIEDRCKKDTDKKVGDLSTEERLKCIESKEHGKRNIVYRVPIDGSTESIKEVYSEWYNT